MPETMIRAVPYLVYFFGVFSYFLFCHWYKFNEVAKIFVLQEYFVVQTFYLIVDTNLYEPVIAFQYFHFYFFNMELGTSARCFKSKNGMKREFYAT